ncbi:MAG TPA: hypothetical protein VKX17_23755 [Planctomycetota bacterium]|nr:hypothetical protein [Planctomycetota bacterium]
MTTDEARSLLTQYADGLLDDAPARELEGVLEKSPDLQAELKQIRDENALLEEALAPLRASKSARMRLSDAMFEVHRQATQMAESLPETGWRIFRLAFCFLTLVGATLLAAYYPPPAEVYVTKGMLLLSVVCVYVIGLTFVLVGATFARIETRLKSALTDRKKKPSALEVLLVQMFGMAAVISSFVMYWWMM